MTFSNVILVDSDGAAILTEDNMTQIDIGDIFLYGIEPVEITAQKSISDLELVTALDGTNRDNCAIV